MTQGQHTHEAGRADQQKAALGAFLRVLRFPFSHWPGRAAVRRQQELLRGYIFCCCSLVGFFVFFLI